MVFANKRAATSATRMKSVVNRFFQMHWRTPIYNLTLVILAIILVLLFSSVITDTEYASFFGMNSGLSVSLFLSMAAFQSVLSRTCSKRASFYRGRALQTVGPTRPHPPPIGVPCTGNLFKC
uniref:ABC-2 type transporter domain-containing protein n=1 Tax=Phytophthora ramorum TaxID=164328 RepID=H3H5X1_PHYRM